MNSADEVAERMTAAKLAERWSVTVESEFVPFSKSRNAGERRGGSIDGLSLNWRVTVKRGERDVVTTDYSAGVGHAPAYKAAVGHQSSVHNTERIEWECEHGKKLRGEATFGGSEPIVPDAADVMYSLVMDYSVLDSATYEDWAEELGYREDSREGERVYRACLEIALKLRAALGDECMSEMQKAFQDF